MRSIPRPLALLAALHLPISLAALAGEFETVPWRGAAWYQVVQAGQDHRLIGGPYKNELACKKAMNVSEPGRSCEELAAAPAASVQVR